MNYNQTRSLYVYIVKCSDGSYYTGVTNDVVKRVAQHNAGLDKRSYTFKRRPVKLVFAHEFQEPIVAIQFEKRIKGWSRIKKEALIQKNWNKLKIYSKCRNKTHSKYHKLEPFDSAQGDS